MITFKQIMKESMELQKFQSAAIESLTFEDFLKSLVGKTIKDLLDASSFFYIDSDDDERIEVLLKKLIGYVSGYINFKKIGPLRDKLDSIDKVEKQTPEFLAWNIKNKSLFKQKMDAIQKGDVELAKKIGDELSNHSRTEPTSYKKNMDDMQLLIKQFHNSKLGVHDVMPSSTDRPEDKKNYEVSKKSFEALKDAIAKKRNNYD
ncbi:MAG: hypothetical protein RLZ10_1794 [Bacteroidota bacterium]|jgi:hypothetical protein